MLHGVAHGGEAVGRAGDVVAFVGYALPGERARVRVTERKPRYVRGRLIALLEEAPERVPPPCPIFAICGGCHWQHADYSAQLRFKSDVLRDQLVRVGKFPRPSLEPALPSPQAWHYRNTVQLVPRSGAPAERRERRLCFQRAHSHDPVPVEHCYISDPLINRAIAAVPWGALTPATWDGLSAVEARVVPQRAVQLILAGDIVPTRGEVMRLVDGARSRLPEISGVLFARRRGGDPYPLWGEDALTYEIGGERLEVPAGAFMQVNLGAAELLVKRVLDWLGPTATDTVLDVYAGVGTFTVPLARRAATVIGVESHALTVQALSRNARHAGCTNVRLQPGAAEVVLPRLERAVDLAVLDPPRRGCAPEVLDAVVRLAPRRIAYVSCEPATLARDLRHLTEAGYALARSGVVDLFPHTYHLESVSLLERA
ncbi:MAG: 23S rRNA (uracil(1939)-C(5))-methyltransferase RlmD [Chloroflexota bacterium]|nr:23S rRNA (uracil(1939)-C(5))-methyltransferase RlmD [Chloroflexota bacterium]